MVIEQRVLGRTGVSVTVLGYGAMELRGAPRSPVLSDAEAGRLLHAVLDSGINLIDTSIDYGGSEELIGRHLAGRRDEFFLATKCGCPIDAVDADIRLADVHDFSGDNVRAGVEQSLRRLRTDRLDLLQIHMSPSRERLDADDTVAAMTRLRDEGKVRFLGMSGTLPHLPDHIAMGVFDVFQIPYSAVQREHEQLITEAARQGAGVLVRGGAARGAAGDKNWERGPLGLPEGEGHRRWNSSGIEDVLRRADMTPHEFVLRYTLSHPDATSTIVGTSSLDHLRANVDIAAKGPLPAEVLDEARQRLPIGDA